MLQRRTCLKGAVCDGTTSEEKGPSEDSCNRAVLEQWRLAKQRSNAMRTRMVTYEELEAQEASRGVNGSGVSLSISVVAPVNSSSTISSTATMEKGNLTAVNENIQGTV